MEETQGFEPLRLRPIQYIPPAPKHIASALDWIPEFAGHAWLAYGAGSIVVITTTPAPTADEEESRITGPFFQQVLQPLQNITDNEDNDDIRAVAWTPIIPSNGVLAVGAGESVYIYEPYSLVPGTANANSVPEMPLAWRQVRTLSHTSRVQAVVWTESGDGLLTTGSEVIMWSQCDNVWNPLWKSKPEQPHSLVSTTWSAKGLAATAADGSTCTRDLMSMTSSSFIGYSKGKVTVYHWEDKYSLQEIELSHPQPISMIQWRPSNFSCFQRPVLLTCSLDGAVRLWIEIESRSVKPDKAFGRGIVDKHVRPIFSVGATIEVNQCLNGILGTNIAVIWAHEKGAETKRDRGRTETNSFHGLSKENNVGNCEWLLGVGPNSSLAWWSLHCLDDVSPFRCPCVYLWKQGTGLPLHKQKFPSFGSYSDSQVSSVLVKAFVQRIGSKLSAPPLSADLFELLPENIFRWSRVWPPVSAVGGGNSFEETIGSEKNCKKSPWSITCQIINQEGHSGRIIQVAVHPVIEVELAASLDSNGLVLFWSLSSSVEFQMGIPTFMHPAWKLSGLLAGCERSSEKKYCFLTWIPLVLREKQFLLLIGHSQGFDCVMVRKVNAEKEMAIQHEMACSIQLPVPLCKPKLECIHAILLSAMPLDNYIKYNIMVTGFGVGGQIVTSWKIVLHVQHGNKIPLSLCRNGIGASRDCIVGASEEVTNEMNLAEKGYYITVETCLPKFINFSDLCQVTSIAVMPSRNLISVCQQSEGALPDASYKMPTYHFATCHLDGFLKLWKISDPQESFTRYYQTAEVSWHCVGLIKVGEGPVKAISLANGGNKIATASSITAFDGMIVNIWDAETYLVDGDFILEDRISLPGCVTALDWLVVGNAQLLLAVAMQNEVRVYSQKRYMEDTLTKPGETEHLHIWICIASIGTPFYIKDLYWGPKAMLVLISTKLMCIVGQWAYTAQRKMQNGVFPMELSAHKSASLNSDSVNSNEKSLKDEASFPKSSLLLSTNGAANEFSSMVSGANIEQHAVQLKTSVISILEMADEIGGPLPVYHPRAVLHCLLTGNRKRAVAYVRHLMAHLNQVDGSRITYKNDDGFAEPFLSIPQMDLSKFLQSRVSKGSYDGELQWGVGTENPISNINELTESSLSHESEAGWLTRRENSHAKCGNDTLGKSEVEGFITALERCPRIPGMTDGERIQLLALLDILAETSSPYEASQYENLDDPARRFWMLVCFWRLHFRRTMGRVAAIGEMMMESRVLAWAYHSDCQDILLDLCLSDGSSWPEMQTLGVGFWFTNIVSLRSRMEKLARTQYLKRRDPKDCALLYMALNRLNVLMGLFKLSKEEKDKPLVGFLARNFQEEKNKAAALKNAYVLKGRHQFELAVAFFLLGDDPGSAVSVCAKDLGDEQLALVICRLVEGSNGPLAKELILKHIFPCAEEKKDYWLISLLQWVLGNSVRSFQQLIQPFTASMSTERRVQMEDPSSDLADILDVACLDSNTGQYCAMLAMKNSFKTRIGDSKAIFLARWATIKTSNALKRSGLPLEALECLSSSANVLMKAGLEGQSLPGSHGDLFGQSAYNATTNMKNNWISGSLAGKLESMSKLNLAMQFISKVIIEHPHWSYMQRVSYKLMTATCDENDEKSHYSLQVEKSDKKLRSCLSILEQKYFIQASDALHALSNFAYQYGRLFLWHHLLHAAFHPEVLQERLQVFKAPTFPAATELLQKDIKETCYVLARVVLSCGYNMSTLKGASYFWGTPRDGESVSLGESDCHQWYMNLMELVYFSFDLKLLAYFMTPEECHSDWKQQKLFKVLDLLMLSICVSVTWLKRDARALLTMIKSTRLADINSSSGEFDMKAWYKQLFSLVDPTQKNAMGYNTAKTFNVDPEQTNGTNNKDSMQLIPADDKWRLVGVCLWDHLLSFVKKELSVYSYSSGDSFGKAETELVIGGMNLEHLERSLLNALAIISAGLKRQFTWHLRQSLNTLPQNPILIWLWSMDSFVKKETQGSAFVSCTPDRHSRLELEKDNNSFVHQGVDTLLTVENKKDECLEQLCQILVFHNVVCSILTSEGFTEFEHRNHGDIGYITQSAKDLKVKDIIEHSIIEKQRDKESNKENTSRIKSVESEMKSFTPNSQSILDTEQRMPYPREKTYITFQKPKDILRKNGELFEAICVNSCNPKQMVVASNRKGLIYHNFTTEDPFFESLYLWSEVEWPRNGWAGTESTPLPTFVSPVAGLGSREGSHLGLGGATVGLGTLAKSGKDLSRGVSFGIPGYAGIGAMGLGWGDWEDFEGFVDPPATVENVSTRALASHPSRPLFLVGSSNTHVYLWEFGKVTATATYGVLPAANIPPPYALASVSAVQFERFGHRFATAALDGTVCAWQLEVGGRSNVRPTESSLCFHKHATDVAFVGVSGSILAATGFSSNGVNMVVWDTLAPSISSRASIVCHEGGARSLAVLDLDIGSGSISPLIVTGGKGGDIGVHDFRFIATGKSKRQRQLKEENKVPSSPLKDTSRKEAYGSSSRQLGEQSTNGMLWYIPKAHQGSITRTSVIPGTSLFLTGSKDGDVKLWDVKKFELIHHWSKVHDKHTFLQPNSRGFGGVVRAAVTDIQVFPYGFLTCGGDGTVKLFQHMNQISDKPT